MIINPIKVAYENISHGIKNTAMFHVEGTYILIRCMARNAKRTEGEVVDWLIKNKVKVKGIIKVNKKLNDSDRDQQQQGTSDGEPTRS